MPQTSLLSHPPHVDACGSGGCRRGPERGTLASHPALQALGARLDAATSVEEAAEALASGGFADEAALGAALNRATIELKKARLLQQGPQPSTADVVWQLAILSA